MQDLLKHSDVTFNTRSQVTTSFRVFPQGVTPKKGKLSGDETNFEEVRNEAKEEKSYSSSFSKLDDSSKEMVKNVLEKFNKIQ